MKKNILKLLVHPHNENHRTVRDFVLDYPRGGTDAAWVTIFTKENLALVKENHKTPAVVTNILSEVNEEKADGVYFVNEKVFEGKKIVKFLHLSSTTTYWKIRHLIDPYDIGISIHGVFLKKDFEMAIKKRYYSFDDQPVEERKFLSAIDKRIGKYDGVYFD